MSAFTDAVQEALTERGAEIDHAVDAIGDEVVVGHLRDLLAEVYNDAVDRFLGIADADVALHNDVPAAAHDVHGNALRYVRAFAHMLTAQFTVMRPAVEDALKQYHYLRGLDDRGRKKGPDNAQ